jgi:hypothetical protein
MSYLHNFTIDKDDFITSDKILNFCNNNSCKELYYIKTDFIKYRHNNSINMYNWRNFNKTIDAKDIKFLISGHSDYEISERELDILNNQNLQIWFCQNKNIQHEKLFSIPIGITNKDEPNSYIHEVLGNTDRLFTISKTPKQIKNLVYLNCTISTYPNEREKIYELYKNENWVTNGIKDVSEDGHYNFLNEIYSHKFVFAPRGNGIDTHRLWESLYLRSIPIVKKCIGMEDFYDLPILFVDDWENITEDFLNKKYEEIMSKEYPLEKLKISYWIDLISNIINTN